MDSKIITLKLGSFCLKKDGIHIETNGLKFKIGYEEENLPFEMAKRWCAERGGDMFSLEQGILTAALRNDINKELKKANKIQLYGDHGYWLNQYNIAYRKYTYVISLHDGFVYNFNTITFHPNRSVRCISVL